LKEELGLDRFDGLSWQAVHRHALMTMIAYASCNTVASHKRGGKRIADRRLNQACRRCVTPSSISFFDRLLSDAHTAEGEPVKAAENLRK